MAQRKSVPAAAPAEARPAPPKTVEDKKSAVAVKE